MARIMVKFGVVQRTSAAGNDYYLIEMRTTDKDGNVRELPDVKLTPFTGRLLLEHLPEFCNAIQEGERMKAAGGQPSQVDTTPQHQGGGVAPDSAGAVSPNPTEDIPF